jgi:hypothetical protein
MAKPINVPGSGTGEGSPDAKGVVVGSTGSAIASDCCVSWLVNVGVRAKLVKAGVKVVTEGAPPVPSAILPAVLSAPAVSDEAVELPADVSGIAVVGSLGITVEAHSCAVCS